MRLAQVTHGIVIDRDIFWLLGGSTSRTVALADGVDDNTPRLVDLEELVERIVTLGPALRDARCAEIIIFGLR
jgi:hypothetical protein